MSDPIKPPARRPCSSCPYRIDVPSGVWAAEEYEKLPPYDEPTWQQPAGVFMCHRQDGRMCAGWVAVHDMLDSLAFRLADAHGRIAEEAVDVIIDYTTDVPLFGSGAEAAEHGLRGVERPSATARHLIDKLTRRKP